MTPHAPQTIDAVALLGWMDRTEAIPFLLELCVFDPPITPAHAEIMWKGSRDAVEALPEREAPAPEKLPITDFHDIEAVKKFLIKFKGTANVLDVIRIDPLKLVVHQRVIVTERSEKYIKKVDSKHAWIRNAILCDGTAAPSLTMKSGFNAIDVDIPHMEFGFLLDQKSGFQIQQLAQHVTVCEFDNRMMLWAGYHRSYARMVSIAPDAIDRSLLVALTTDGTFMVSPDSPNQGVREMLRGRRAPLFGDFFDERFVIKVKLRKKRFELQIRGRIVAIDETR